MSTSDKNKLPKVSHRLSIGKVRSNLCNSLSFLLSKSTKLSGHQLKRHTPVWLLMRPHKWKIISGQKTSHKVKGIAQRTHRQARLQKQQLTVPQLKGLFGRNLRQPLPRAVSNMSNQERALARDMNLKHLKQVPLVLALLYSTSSHQSFWRK